jgi:hypothetical protein
VQELLEFRSIGLHSFESNFLDDCSEKFFFVFEVTINRCLDNVGFSGDAIHACARISVFQENLNCRLNNLVLLAARATAANYGGCAGARVSFVLHSVLGYSLYLGLKSEASKLCVLQWVITIENWLVKV